MHIIGGHTQPSKIAEESVMLGKVYSPHSHPTVGPDSKPLMIVRVCILDRPCPSHWFHQVDNFISVSSAIQRFVQIYLLQ